MARRSSEKAVGVSLGGGWEAVTGRYGPVHSCSPKSALFPKSTARLFRSLSQFMCGHLGHSFLILLIYWLLEKGEGREKERERNIDVRQKHGPVASHRHPDQGLSPDRE